MSMTNSVQSFRGDSPVLTKGKEYEGQEVQEKARTLMGSEVWGKSRIPTYGTES